MNLNFCTKMKVMYDQDFDNVCQACKIAKNSSLQKQTTTGER